MDDCSIYHEETNLLRNLVNFKELEQGLKITPYLSREVLTSLENSTLDLLTIFNELEGEQKEFSKSKETSVIGRKN